MQSRGCGLLVIPSDCQAIIVVRAHSTTAAVHGCYQGDTQRYQEPGHEGFAQRTRLNRTQWTARHEVQWDHPGLVLLDLLPHFHLA
jgi:hypothetical protein